MNYLIIGANAAGLSAAVRIRKADKTATITVLEKSDIISFGACGIPYYVGGEFDDIERMSARELADFTKLGIDIKLFHTAINLDHEARKVSASHQSQTIDFKYDKLFIASGASPIVPAIKGLMLDNTQPNQRIFTMHSRADAEMIKTKLVDAENIVVIGGGFIGVEAIEAFAHQGKKVTLIEFGERVLSKTFDPEITDLLEAEMRRKEIQLAFQERVIEIESNPSDQKTPMKVITDKSHYLADLVILATGFKPNTDFLANNPILRDQHSAIIIDELGQTNLPDVYAAGDCATVPHRILGDRYIPLATTANKLGRLIGGNMAGAEKPFIGTLGSSGVRIFDLEAGRTGITEAEAKQQQINYAVVFIKDKNRTDYVLPQTDIWIKLIYNQSSRTLLGGQICGSYGSGSLARVNALAVAIYAKLSVDELGFMDFIYAPPFARTWDALNIAGNVAK